MIGYIAYDLTRSHARSYARAFRKVGNSAGSAGPPVGFFFVLLCGFLNMLIQWNVDADVFGAGLMWGVMALFWAGVAVLGLMIAATAVTCALGALFVLVAPFVLLAQGIARGITWYRARGVAL